MRLPQAILVFGDSPEVAVSFAAAAVLSTLFGVEKLVLKGERAVDPSELPKKSLLLMSCLSQERQIGRLVRLRLYGFNGGVLVISHHSFESLRARHRILRWGQGSHDVCRFPCNLADLITKVAELVPLERENLSMLQSELKAPDRLLEHRVIPCLKRLERRNRNLSREVDTITTIINDLRAHTPVACHTVVKIGGREAQIQEHFRILVEEVRSLQEFDDRPLELLREVFERWRDLLLNVGEGVGLLS